MSGVLTLAAIVLLIGFVVVYSLPMALLTIFGAVR